jgi:hypothetical protein
LFLLISLLIASCAGTPGAPTDRFIADLDPLPAGTIEAGIIKPFSTKVDKISIPVSFDPRTNRVCLEFSYEFVPYRQYWNAANRLALITAAKQYQTDYLNKELPAGNRSAAAKRYGSIKAEAVWALFKFTTPARSYPRIDLGYRFQNNSPYFTITQNSAPNMEVSDQNKRANSLFIVLYFTRSLLGELAAVFDQDYLISLLPEYLILPDTDNAGNAGGSAPNRTILGDDY